MKKHPTKILPPDYDHVFERKNLYEIIKQRQTSKVIWINGEPGSGKTTFIANYLKKQQEPFIWYRADANEKNFEDFFYFLTLAAEKNYPRKKLKLPVFTSEYANDLESFVRVFFRQLFASLTNESTIVLDNCQELEKNVFFTQMLQIVLNELPQGLQLICISRNRPNNGLRRLYLNNELFEISNFELKFNDLESQAFLRWLNPQLDDRQIHLVQSKTQGWAAGMVLMAEQFDKADFVDDLDASKNIFDYLVSEIISQLPKKLHEFLVSNALFSQLSVEMGIALTGFREAKPYLDKLVAKNFFIERTAGPNPSFRYHPLFRNLLLTQADDLFSKKDWRKLQNKAAIILVQQGRYTEALELYKQIQDWPFLRDLLLQKADQLIKSGRHQTVSQLMEALPNDYLSKDEWLCYWYAVALKAIDPTLAEEYLEKCYQQFIINNDVKGIYSAWQAAVESIVISWDDFSRLRIWMVRFDEIRSNYSNCPSIELKVRFYATAVQALTFYNPNHLWLRGLIRISEGLLRFSPLKIVKVMLSIPLGHYYVATCQLTKLQIIAPYLKSALDSETLPALPKIMSTYLLGMLNLNTADATKALTYSYQGLEFSNTSGIHVFKGLLLANTISCHICSGDLPSARKALQKSIKSENNRQRMFIALNYSYAAWLEALEGNKNYALEQNQQALQLTKSIGIEMGYVCSLAIKVQILAELEQWKKAEQTFTLLSVIVKDTNNQHNLTQYYLSDAWLAYLQNDQARLLIAVKNLLQMLRAEQVFFFFGLRPEVLSPLCLWAIENNIEDKFAVRLLKSNQLFSRPPLYIEKWPWPVRIYSFGSFNIEIDGKLINKSGKSQKKIFELLSVIVLLGGRNVDGDQLGEILWPDADGDLARRSLETALHRLRKLIGREAVLVNAGMISLNDNYCWLDLWSFEMTAAELENILKNSKKQSLVVKLIERLLKLYQDTFLKNSNSGLAILKQEQLLNKLCLLLDQATDFYEQFEKNEYICFLLRKNLELNPLQEANYYRLMAHYIELNQPEQALQIYQQCQRIFKGFNLILSDKIESLAKKL